MSSTKRRLLLSLAGVAALGLSACAGGPMGRAPPPTNGRDAAALSPLDQYPVRAVERPHELALRVHGHGDISPAQDAALASFAEQWRATGGMARVVVRAPTGAPDGHAAAQHAADRLASLGVPAAAVAVDEYDAAGAPDAPVLARYEALTADAPDCSRGWDNLVATNGNNVSTHFGCANARNFAAMLADPHDLVAPRAITPADAGRRAVVLDKYRQGQVTASAKDDQASGAVSQRVR